MKKLITSSGLVQLESGQVGTWMKFVGTNGQPRILDTYLLNPIFVHTYDPDLPRRTRKPHGNVSFRNYRGHMMEHASREAASLLMNYIM